MAKLYHTINGVDVSAKVAKGSTTIKNALTSEPDTATFLLRDPVSAPREGHAIQIYVDDVSDMRFAGIIDTVVESPLSTFSVMQYQVSAIDYARVLEYTLVATVYQNQTDAAIITDIITNNVSAVWGFTLTNVLTGTTISEISFNYVTVAEAIRMIAELTGYEWYVDYNKDIHYFPASTTIAPYHIIDTALFSFQNFFLQPDFSNVRNKVTVTGGTFLSSPLTESFAGDDTTATYTLTYKPHELVLTENGVNKTVGIINITDPSTVDYIMDYWNKTVERQAGVLPTGTTLAATYSYDVKVITQTEDVGAQATIAALEGGDGIHEYRLVDNSIQSIDEAQLRAEAETRMYSVPLVRGGFNTFENGFAAGQLITINLTGGNYNGDYLIRRVTHKSIGGGNFNYRIEFSRKRQQIEDILVNLIRKVDKTSAVSSEGIDKLALVTEEIEFSESIAVTTKDISVTPYTWGVHADQGEWGFSEWQ